MLSREEYLSLHRLKETDAALYSLLAHVHEESMAELSTASHDINNYAATLKTAHQFITKKTPCLQEQTYWNKMGDTIDKLIEYMNRTSLYRYCFRPADCENIVLEEILYSIPDYLDEKYTGERSFSFNIEKNLPLIHAERMLIETAIREAACNAYEASNEKSELGITCVCIDNHIRINISNQAANPPENGIDYNIEKLCRPFYTDKDNHAGLGLSIIHQTCLNYMAKLHLNYNNGITNLEMIFPVT